MLSALGILGVFRIFVTRTAEVTSLAVDVYHSPIMGVQVRFRTAHFLELQNSCNSKKLYCDMQCQILCLEKLSLIRGNLPNVCLVSHANKNKQSYSKIQKQQGWLDEGDWQGL